MTTDKPDLLALAQRVIEGQVLPSWKHFEALAEGVVELTRERDEAAHWRDEWHALSTTLESRLAEVERERDEAVQKGAELLAASLRQTATAVGESEARRKTLLEKSDELRREWQRAENAEAERDALREQLAGFHLMR